MSDSPSPKRIIIGRVELVSFSELGPKGVAARIDTGAKTSSIWATHIQEKDGTLHFTLFGDESPYHTGQVHAVTHFEKTVVASSIGEAQERYKVRIVVKIKGKKIRARFTLADRSKQVYPVLIGRNVLRGKFVVDVEGGKPLYKEERERSASLQSKLGARG